MEITIGVLFIIEFLDYTKQTIRNEKNNIKKCIYIIRHLMFLTATFLSLFMASKSEVLSLLTYVCWGIVLISYIVCKIIFTRSNEKNI